MLDLSQSRVRTEKTHSHVPQTNVQIGLALKLRLSIKTRNY